MIQSSYWNIENLEVIINKPYEQANAKLMVQV